MEISKRLLGTRRTRWLAALTVVAVALLLATLPLPTRAGNGRVVAIYHDGIEHTVVTDAPTVAEVLKRTNISVTEFDSVEPGLDTQLTAPSYNVNIYRARPVTVVDGNQRHQVMSPHTSARKIAEDAGLAVREEDEFDLQRIDNFIAEEGVGLRMTIQRAIPVNLVLYGKPSHVYTQAATVQELLTEKQVTIGEADGTNLALAAGLTPGITVEVWRDGEQTITEELAVAFPVERIRDTDQPVGYRQIKTPGKNGKKLVTYAVELKNGQEIGRKEMQSVVTEEPVKQVEVIGVQPGFNGPIQEALAKLRMCEAGGRYDRNSGNGYYGAYQFNIGTWGNYQGYARADLAPPEVQDQKAYETYLRRGWQPWPACSQKLGLQDIYR